jgi:transposase
LRRLSGRQGGFGRGDGVRDKHAAHCGTVSGVFGIKGLAARFYFSFTHSSPLTPAVAPASPSPAPMVRIIRGRKGAGERCPILMLLLESQTSDYIGARALVSSISWAGAPLADRGYDADLFRNTVIDKGIQPCILSRSGRKVEVPHVADLYRLRHRIENMFARLNDRRRIATRYDRSPILFLSAYALAATVIYWM